MGSPLLMRCKYMPDFRMFVEKTDAPVCDTLMGKGAYDGTSENYTGMLGMHGTKTSNLGVSECDLQIGRASCRERV